MKQTFYLTPTPNSVAAGLQHSEEKQRRIKNGEDQLPDPDIANREIDVLCQKIEQAGGQYFLGKLLTDSPDEVFRQDVGYAVYDFNRNKRVYIRFPMGAEKRAHESRPFFEYLAKNHSTRFDEFIYWANEHEPGLDCLDITTHRFPGTAEGGDLFPPAIIDETPTIIVGLRNDSDKNNPIRTTPDGIQSIKILLENMSYNVVTINFWNTLHLTSIGSMIGLDTQGRATVMIDKSRCDWQSLEQHGFRVLGLPNNIEGQEWGLNAIRVNDTLIVQEGYPAVKEMLQCWAEDKIGIVTSPWKELKKVDGSFTCAAIFSGVHGYG